MNFMFEWQEQYRTSERSERVRYCTCHANVKFISSRHRVIFSIYRPNKLVQSGICYNDFFKSGDQLMRLRDTSSVNALAKAEHLLTFLTSRL